MSDPHELLRDDPDLGPLVDEHGALVVEPHADPFERLVVSIVRQQVSMDAADAIEQRLFDAVEATPEAMAAADPAVLRDAGLSSQKTEYVRNVAEAFTERGYDHDYFRDLTDDAVRDELTSISGVGPWTADMFLMFGLGREDVFPVGDLGIRKGMQSLFGEGTTRAEMRDIAERWQPYRSYAALYVWRAYEG
ncbi:DNA-3-methyladenine glycosylase family protein [Halobacterium jilantaiense]|uniref:DNA-3-methyladenine glycosylase II n=1 Tax=Halobacterium jilantaiense TaxID=355548 RepID=A0A1I0MM73_9EURY|nr:DNA-3-methyladenine glycosylase [Halobacterium jilantaiense]SEV89058.1 DNA-3-methyladenine glycosylase II [Halobacterium jilantaiense]